MADGDNITTLRPVGSTKDKTAAERARRFRRKKRKGTVTRHVTPSVTVPVTPSSVPTVTSSEPKNVTQTVTGPLRVTAENVLQHKAVTQIAGDRPHASSVTVIDALAVTAAVTLAGTAAYFSIRGMTVLFPGSPTAIVVMGVAMEAGKLATVAWLARHWRASSWTVRNVLAVLILTIAAINAAGVYSQLIAAHLGEHTAAVSAVGVQASALDARIEMQAHTVADLDRRIAQIDSAIETATQRGRTSAAMKLADDQRKARAGLVDDRKHEAGNLATLRAERATVAAKGKTVESEAAPIQYVAAVFGVSDPEVAIRWLVLFMTLACDPLAIALTAAASARRQA
jgi:hypothetical protein